MPTTRTLENIGVLIKITTDLEAGELDERLLFATPDFIAWLEDYLPYYDRDRDHRLSPNEQVESIFHEYIANPQFRGGGYFQNITPQREGIYELKTTDIRIFGWFWRPRQFIAVSGEMKKTLKGRYDIYRKNAVATRESLDLDEPKFVKESIIGKLL